MVKIILTTKGSIDDLEVNRKEAIDIFKSYTAWNFCLQKEN